MQPLWRALLIGSPLLALPGAVAGAGVDAGVAAHYGDPFAEQRSLAAGTAWVDLSHRPVVRVEGPDRLRWLNDLTSQQLLDLPAGQWTQALVLSPTGHVEHHLHLVDDGTAVRAHLEPGTEAALGAYLDQMRFLLRVEVSWPALSVVLGPTGFALVPAEQLADRPGPWAGLWAYEALRVARLEPRLGLDTDHRTLPNEVGWLVAAVALDKGCYRGQEAVARVYNLGRPPRRLVLLHLDGSESELPSPGQPVRWEEREVGRVGTVARHYELGPVALALVRRQLPADVDVMAGEVPARIDPTPMPDVPESPARAAAAARSGLLRPSR